MKVEAEALKTIAYHKLLRLIDDELSYTDRVDDGHYAAAMAALALMRELDSGKKRIVLDILNPVDVSRSGGP